MECIWVENHCWMIYSNPLPHGCFLDTLSRFYHVNPVSTCVFGFQLIMVFFCQYITECVWFFPIFPSISPTSGIRASRAERLVEVVSAWGVSNFCWDLRRPPWDQREVFSLCCVKKESLRPAWGFFRICCVKPETCVERNQDFWFAVWRRRERRPETCVDLPETCVRRFFLLHEGAVWLA